MVILRGDSFKIDSEVVRKGDMLNESHGFTCGMGKICFYHFLPKILKIDYNLNVLAENL